MSLPYDAWIIEFEGDWSLHIESPDGLIERNLPFNPANLTKLVAYAYAWSHARGLPIQLHISSNRRADR